MKKIRFKLKISRVRRPGDASVDSISVDGVTKDGRIWRGRIQIEKELTLSKSEICQLKDVVRELLPALIKAGYHAPDVEKMDFSIDLEA